jgi:hypothetical protein
MEKYEKKNINSKKTYLRWFIQEQVWNKFKSKEYEIISTFQVQVNIFGPLKPKKLLTKKNKTHSKQLNWQKQKKTNIQTSFIKILSLKRFAISEKIKFYIGVINPFFGT